MHRVLLAVVILFSFTYCPAPSTSGNFIVANPLNRKASILPEEVVIFRDAIPPGIKKNSDGDAYEVETKYKNKIELLGKIEVRLQNGMVLVPGRTFSPYYIRDEDEGFLGKYCRNNPLIVLPLPLFNIINPLGWPCFAVDNYAGTSVEAEEYKAKVRDEIIRKKAAENGAHVVFVINGYDGLLGAAQSFLKNNLNTTHSQYGLNLDRQEIFAVHVLDKSYLRGK